MAVGIFGGSFDPIHNGHLITTRSVLEKRKLEKIILIPSFISPLKQNINYTHQEHRLNMVKLAAEQLKGFEVDDLELIRGKVSYTYETILELRKRYDDIELIIGYDNLLVFEDWHRPDEILDLVKVIVMKREVDLMPDKHNRFFDKVIFVDTPRIEISSTEIRRRVMNGLPINCLVPDKVDEYILKEKLYSK